MLREKKSGRVSRSNGGWLLSRRAASGMYGKLQEGWELMQENGTIGEKKLRRMSWTIGGWLLLVAVEKLRGCWREFKTWISNVIYVWEVAGVVVQEGGGLMQGSWRIGVVDL